VAAVLALAGAPAAAQDVKPVSFTAAQAETGRDLYGTNCGSCHGADLMGSEFAPSLKTARFRRERGSGAAGELLGYVRTNMPPTQPGNLPNEDYAAILAYLMQANGAPEGAAFPADPASKAPLALQR
jgi:mono/diheme cytochrome c family protein